MATYPITGSQRNFAEAILYTERPKPRQIWVLETQAGGRQGRQEFRRNRPDFCSCVLACRSSTLIFEDSISDGREP